MKSKASRSGFPIQIIRNLAAIICSLALVPGDVNSLARPMPPPAPPAEEEGARVPAEQLDSLVAPIALYPDPLLSQTLVASTYPLEIIQLQQWLGKNKDLKDQALADAVKKQDWDPSIQAMAALPDVVKQMADNITWTTDLGNAFLAQQNDVMEAVQRMRKKAEDGGNLKSSEQQKVETKVVGSQQVIVIEQASPEIVYVPSYNPTVVYGAPVYPYPAIAYPPPGYYAAGMAISFGVGLAMGAAWGGGWGYNSNWGGNNNIYINNNNNFVKNSNRQNVSNRTGGGNTWQHNPQHRGGAPYSNRATANKYGGTARGDSTGSRQDRARQNQSQRGGQQQASTRDRTASGSRQQASARERSTGGGDAGTGNRGAGTGNASSNRGGGGDRVGNRSVPSDGGSRSSSAFGGGSGSSARSSSARGSSSMGGGSRSGSRGGGGRRR